MEKLIKYYLKKELPNTLSITNKLTKSEIDNIKIQWTLEKKKQSVRGDKRISLEFSMY